MGNNHDKYSIDNTDYTVGQDNVKSGALTYITRCLASVQSDLNVSSRRITR